MQDILKKHNVQVLGTDGQPIVFAHGYGCDSNMWRWVAPAFLDTHRVILFDHMGCGRSDTTLFRAANYQSLQDYARDVLAICAALDLRDVIYVGHSVSAMIGVEAVVAQPERFAKLVLVGPSPRYINDGDYVGGFSQTDIEGLLESLESNYLGWSSTMAPMIMGNADQPELGEELTNSFCQMNPAIAQQFARVTFLSDSRAELARVRVPTLILQCAEDIIAGEAVGTYVQKQIPDSHIVFMEATGHCPNLSAPAETIAAIKDFI